MQLEQQLIAPWLAELHGETVLWVGYYLPEQDPFANLMIRNPTWVVTQERVAAEHRAAPHAGTSVCFAHAEELPFQSRTVDGVILQHSLETAIDARVALREAARVLVPGGRLIVNGFNPVSLLGLRQLYADYRPDVLTGRHMVNPLRLFDWLTLLGLELHAAPQYRAPRLFFDRQARKTEPAEPVTSKWRRAALPVRRWLHEIPFGGVFAVHAVKQTGNYRMQWRREAPARAAGQVAYPRIASWQQHELATAAQPATDKAE